MATAAERSAQAVGRLRAAQAQLDEARRALASEKPGSRADSELLEEVGKFFKQVAKDKKRATALIEQLNAKHLAAKAAFRASDERKEQILEQHGDVAFRDLRSSAKLSAAEREVVRRTDELEEKVSDLAEKKKDLVGALKNTPRHEAMVREIEAAAKRGDEKTVTKLGSKLSSAKTLRSMLVAVDPLDEEYLSWNESSLSFDTILGADLDVFAGYRESRREDTRGVDAARARVARWERAVRVHEREVSRLSRRAELAPNIQGAARYYVWVLPSRSNTPVSGEGPYGPYPLRTAEQMARIGAKEGVHDRVVSLGKDPRAHGFRIERRYAARSGARLV